MASEKIIKNWLALADYDITLAEAMLQTGRYVYVTFMCQQAIEKVMKALYVQEHQETPPYTHNLIRLLGLLFFASEVASDIYDQTKRLYQWLLDKIL